MFALKIKRINMNLNLLKRFEKGSALTWQEFDQNLTDIENMASTLPVSKHIAGSFQESKQLNLFTGTNLNFSTLDTSSPLPLVLITLKGNALCYIGDGYGGTRNELFNTSFDKILGITYYNLNNNIVPRLMEYAIDGYGNYDWVLVNEIENDVIYDFVDSEIRNQITLLGAAFDVEYFEFQPLSSIGYKFDLKFIHDPHLDES
jgi:hypothetical protein